MVNSLESILHSLIKDEKFFNGFESKMFLKAITFKQMIERFPMSVAPVKWLMHLKTY